ncbi:T9SS type A sorting domain-containing protein [Flavobacterium sp. SM2513]|uniref:T9SS type A sorting domain-containing protein n=1 Tax=Flavobacterium sp. SM2513 TaxID=3424766 RepID=UPI003D7F3AE1
MKKALLILLFVNGLGQAFAQSPVIEGDTMLCPYTNGTAAVTNGTYDTYQWYSKYWFTSDPYQPITGATEASFTYDWYTYDQSLFKVVVTSGTQTFESNSIQIDSYAWSSLIVSTEMNEFVSTNMSNGNFMLCPGGSFNSTLGSPYTANIQWYKDDVAIPGATMPTYSISEPGTYYVEGAPEFCPDSMSQGMPLVVETNADCNLGTNDSALAKSTLIYPNPVANSLHLTLPAGLIISSYSIINSSGQLLQTKKVNFTDGNTIDVSALSGGLYVLQLESNTGVAIQKFSKK